MKRVWVAILCFLAVYLIATVHKHYSPNRGDVKLREAEALLAAVPVYPGAEEVRSAVASKNNIASASKYYKSDAAYGDLKQHLSEKLTGLGWGYEGERQFKRAWTNLDGYEMYFRRGEYSAVVEYAGREADFGWDYTISVSRR